MSDRKLCYLDDTDNVSFSLDVTSILGDVHLSEVVENGVELDIPKLCVIPATPIKLESSPEFFFNVNGTSGKIKVHDTSKNEEATENLDKTTDNVSFSSEVVKNGVELDIPELRVIPATPIKLESSPEFLFNVNGTSGKIKVHDTSKNEETTENLEKKVTELKEYLNQHDSCLQKMILENNKKTEEIEQLEKIVAKLESENNLVEKIKNAEAENEKLNIYLKKEKDNKEELLKIMKGYEQTLAELIASKQEKILEYEKEKEKISSERDDAISHLNNLEVAFQDVHLKYEKSKAAIEQMKNNEIALKKSLKEYGEIIENKNNLYDKLKIQANKKLAAANEEISNLTKFNENEIIKVKSQIKKAELTIKSLEEELERKKSEVLELSKICEELC